MDGITLAAQCKRYFPNMRVVIMSACSDKVIPAMGTAVDAVVQKPFSPQSARDQGGGGPSAIRPLGVLIGQYVFG